jgi:hypothetical protein
MRSEEDRQAGFVHAGSHCLSRAQLPVPPHPDQRGPQPDRFRRRKQQKDDGMTKEREQDQALLLVGSAGQVRIDPASPLLVTGMTAHVPSMQHRAAKLGMPTVCPIA